MYYHVYWLQLPIQANQKCDDNNDIIRESTKEEESILFISNTLNLKKKPWNIISLLIATIKCIITKSYFSHCTLTQWPWMWPALALLWIILPIEEQSHFSVLITMARFLAPHSAHCKTLSALTVNGWLITSLASFIGELVYIKKCFPSGTVQVSVTNLRSESLLCGGRGVEVQGCWVLRWLGNGGMDGSLGRGRGSHWPEMICCPRCW